MNDNGATPPTLSEAARETLLRLQSQLILDRFSEEAAGELASLGYATRRSFFLSLTDKGMLAARRLISAKVPVAATAKPLRLATPSKPRPHRQEKALRYKTRWS